MFLIRAALASLWLNGFPKRHDVGNLPKPISHTSSHRWSDAKRLMDADEIIIRHVKRDCIGMVLDLLGKRIRQPGKAAHVHP